LISPGTNLLVFTRRGCGGKRIERVLIRGAGETTSAELGAVGKKKKERTSRVHGSPRRIPKKRDSEG